MGDDFLSRWSRRKQAVQDSEAKPLEPATDTESTAGDVSMEALVADEAAPEAAPEAPLPAIEDLTADSDITQFLRRNVPEALKRAALRRAWSLDPAIRDFVGPAEYAWDFNTPGSMAGFGPAPLAGLAGTAAESGAVLPARLDAKEIAVREPVPLAGSEPPREAAVEPDTEPALAQEPSELPQAGSPEIAVGSTRDRDQHAKDDPRPGSPRHGSALPR